MQRQTEPAKWWWAALSLLLLGLVFWPWFAGGFLSYGDWWHILPSRAVEYSQHLLIWDAARNFGSPLSNSATHNAIHWFYGFFWQTLGLSTAITARLFWYIPFIVFVWVGSWKWGYLLTGRRLGALVTALLYTFNTFSLNTVQGGQMTLAVSYALAPLTLFLLLKLLNERRVGTAAWLGLTAAIQAIYDVRMLAITLLAGLVVIIYKQLNTVQKSRQTKSLIKLLSFSAMLAGLLSAYWLLPMLTGTSGSAGVPVDYTNTGWISSLSYATLAHGLATNHVWWPWSEGVLNPIQPLFYVTFLLALVALLNWHRNKYTLLLFSLALFGVFLLKGGNEPFEGLYAWLFVNVPGFIMFRDPAKFFALLFIGLAPAAALGTIHLVDSLKKRWRPLAAAVILGLLWLPLYPFWAQARHGTFVPQKVPVAYLNFQDFFAQDESFSRSLWVPTMQRYIPYTQNHPAVSLKDVTENEWSAFKDQTGEPLSFLNHPYAQWLLNHSSIKYVGLPLDTENEIYRHYGSYEIFLNAVQGRSWLKEVTSGSSDVRVFANTESKDELWLANQAVALDKEIVNDYAPTLNDQDVLLLNSEQEGESRTSSTQERLRVLALDSKNLSIVNDTATWHFETPTNFSGDFKIESNLSSYPVSLDSLSKPITQKGELLSLGNLNLAKGSHTLSLKFGNPPNLAYKNGFASTAWVPCTDARNRLIYPDSFYYADENGGKEGVQMIYSSEEAPGCMGVRLGVLPAGLYRVSVLSRTEVGTGLDAQLLLDEEGVTTESLPKDPNWQTLTFLVEVSKNQPASILLLAKPFKVGDQVISSKVAVADISVQQIITSVPKMVVLESGLKDSEAALPTITFERQKPGYYRVSVGESKNDYYLILNQAFNEGWRVTGATPKEHLTVNGFANGWLMPAGGATEIIIEFGNINPFRWGTTISILSLIVALSVGWRSTKILKN